MENVLSIIQNAYVAWTVAVLILIGAFSIIKSNSNKYSSQIKAIRDDSSKEIKAIQNGCTKEIQQVNDRANELIRQNRAQCDAMIQHERETTEAAIQHERALSAERIKLLQEQIEADKTAIMKKPDKEILADLTVSLSRFAKRIDRVESRLTPIEQEMELIVDKVDNIGVTVSDAQFHL